MNDAYLLTLSCTDRPGIVAAVSGCLADHGGNIRSAQQYEDAETGRFFMRVSFALVEGAAAAALEQGFARTAAAMELSWNLRPVATRKRVLLMVSKFDHCLADLLYRWRIGELAMDVTGIVANHPRETYAHLDLAGLPFHYLPVEAGDREAQERRVRAIIDETDTDLIVLARYMQILSDKMAAHLAGRCINIHHSFLPGFKGAKPYHQAHARGDRPLCHRRPRRGADHRTGCRADQPYGHARDAGPQGPGHRAAGACARGGVPSRGPYPHQRREDRGVQGLTATPRQERGIRATVLRHL
jgi:formyltetrahydrofolate deformylase